MREHVEDYTSDLAARGHTCGWDPMHAAIRADDLLDSKEAARYETIERGYFALLEVPTATAHASKKALFAGTEPLHVRPVSG